MLDDDAPKIYGLDNIRTDAPVYVTEGPFDSTFLRNAIAMCGADADVDRWGERNFLNRQLAKAARWSRKASSQYRLEAEARVKGVALNPFDKKVVELE